MDLRAEHRDACDAFSQRVGAVGPGDLVRATPCDGWDVTDLLSHVVRNHLFLAPLLAGRPPKEIKAELSGDVLGDDWCGAWEAASRSALAAFEAPGALEQPIRLAMGTMPGASAVEVLTSDVLIHTWDLARATGTDERLPPALVRSCFERAKPLDQLLRATGMFGSALTAPDGADEQKSMLAFFGRQT
jgi:uncharacterized protein (TIGR03086 family)